VQDAGQGHALCGPGTYLLGNVCLPAPAVAHEGGALADATVPPVQGGAGQGDAQGAASQAEAGQDARPPTDAGEDEGETGAARADGAADADEAALDGSTEDVDTGDVGTRDGSVGDGGTGEGGVGTDASKWDASPIASYGLDDAGALSAAPCFAVDPAHDNAQPGDAVASPLQAAWTAQFSGAVVAPVVAGGRVFVAAKESQPNVRALDAGTGTLIWGPVVFGSVLGLAYDRAKIFALDSSGSLTALDASDGHSLWSIVFTSQYIFGSPPVASGGIVYVDGLGSGGTTYAVDESTGSILWTTNTFDGSSGAVAVSGGTVYEAEACDQLSSLNAANGTLNWYRAGSCTGGGGAAPAVSGDLIWERDWASGNIIYDSAGASKGTFTAAYIPSIFTGTVYYVESGSLSAVEVATRTLKWTFAGDGNLDTSAAIAGGGGQIFVGSSSGNVYEIDSKTGGLRSTADAGAGVTAGSETTSMAIAGGHLFVPAGNTLVAY
jgi:outer membrane protein assembly factor BamB